MLKLRSIINWLILLTTLSSDAPANTWYANATLGGGFNSMSGQSDTLTLATTPTPGITNRYSTNNNDDNTFLAGVGLGYRFKINGNYDLALGLQADYINYRSMQGTVYPMINVAPDFDILNFTYNAQSYLLLLEPTVFYKTGTNFNPFISLGVGVAWNHLASYSESPPTGSTATPDEYPFNNATTSRFAYAPSIGLEWVLTNKLNVHFSYQYVNSGYATLKPGNNQQTNQALSAGHLSAQFFVVSFLIA